MKTQSTTKQTLKLFWHFVRQYKFLFWYGTIASVVATIVSDILPPLIIASAFNKLQALYSHNQTITFAEMQNYLFAYITVQVLALVLWRTQAYCAWKYFILAERNIMNTIFNKLQSMDPKFHADRFGGALVSQSNKFVSAFDRFASDFNWSILTGITAFFAALTVLFFVNYVFASVFLLAAIVYCTVVYRQMLRQIPYNTKLSSSESQTTAKLADTITNVSTVRAFAGETYEAKLFDNQATKTRDSYLKLMSVQLKNELISQSGTVLISISAFTLGIIGIISLNLKIGSLYLAMSYTMNLTNRLWNFMFIVRNLNRQFGDASDMTKILQMEPKIADIPAAKQLQINRAGIEFENISFGYSEGGSDHLFQNLSLSIKPGQQVGLVGHSGGGKSSLVRLLSRFMDIDSGQILIDGQEIRQVTQQSLRKNIAYVPQDPLLFHRSLMENIRYGRPEASDDEVIAVSKLAHAHEFIETLPKGYDTLVGERGVKLSGGQRQRVAIARAMLKNAPILVLDEATSALDSESEVLIQDALWKLMEGRTAIVIAHRLSTIQKMDRIIVLEDGKIVEQGSHKALLQTGGTYSRLWAHQSGGFIEDEE